MNTDTSNDENTTVLDTTENTIHQSDNAPEVDTENDNTPEVDAENETPTNKDNNEDEDIVYSLDLKNVNYNSTFRTNKGALSQLIMNLNDMQTRLDAPTETNKIQCKLYPVIVNICDRLYTKYVTMTSNVADAHVREFSYFLMGPYGNGTLRHPTAIRAERKMYKYSELGPTFRAMSNRIAHASREVESRLETDKYSGDTNSYTALREFLVEFLTELKDCSEEWKNTVYKVRDEEGIEKKEKPVTRFKKNVNKKYNNFKSGTESTEGEKSQGHVRFRRNGGFTEHTSKQN